MAVNAIRCMHPSYNRYAQNNSHICFLLLSVLIPQGPSSSYEVVSPSLSLQHESLETSPLIALANPSGDRAIRNDMQNNLYASYTIKRIHKERLYQSTTFMPGYNEGDKEFTPVGVNGVMG